MSRLIYSVAIMLLALCQTEYTFAASTTGSGQLNTHTFDAQAYSGSKTREYKVYVPDSYSSNQEVPMIMALHGCAMDHNDAITTWNFDLIADQQNVIIVYPFITSYSGMRNENCWGYWFSNEIHEGAGEAADLYNIAKEVESQYSIDPDRRYITGLSSGGGMTVVEAIAYNEYWAAAASVSGLAYDDWSSSVLSDMFKSESQHTASILNELDNDRPIPMMVMNSQRDEIVRITAGELIRDSHLSAFDINKNADSTEDCSAEGVSCTKTNYNDHNGNTIVQTVFFNGLIVGPKKGQYGAGHYWSGDDKNYEKWAWDVGPSTSQLVWDFFADKSFSGQSAAAKCNNNDYLAPNTPTGLKVTKVNDHSANLTINKNSEGDIQGYQLYTSNGNAVSGVINGTSLTASNLSSNRGYQLTVIAIDTCGNKSEPSAYVNVTISAPTYIAETKIDNALNFYLDKIIDVNDYIAYIDKYGQEPFTLYKQQDGSWNDSNPNGDSNEYNDTDDTANDTSNNQTSDYCQSFDGTNQEHVDAKRAESVLWGWYAQTIGAEESLGLLNATTSVTLYESPQGYFSKVQCVVVDNESDNTDEESQDDSNNNNGIYSIVIEDSNGDEYDVALDTSDSTVTISDEYNRDVVEIEDTGTNEDNGNQTYDITIGAGSSGTTMLILGFFSLIYRIKRKHY